MVREVDGIVVVGVLKDVRECFELSTKTYGSYIEAILDEEC